MIEDEATSPEGVTRVSLVAGTLLGLSVVHMWGQLPDVSCERGHAFSG
jgi:hypothetical protein